MSIVPADAVTILTTQLTTLITANSIAIVSVLAFAVGLRLIMKWFDRSTKRVRA